MGENALREGTAGGGGSEGLGETEGLSDGEEGLDVNERGAHDRLFFVNDTSSLGHALVDSTNSVIGALDLDQEDGLHESWGGSELRGEEDTSGSGDDLTATSMDSISMEGNILDVETDSSHVLVSQDTLLGSPLESGLDGVLDFIEVLNLLGGINDQVGASVLRAETPNFLGIIGIPIVIVLENSHALLDILLLGDLVILDGLSKVITERGSLTEDSVMLVGGFGKADNARCLDDGLLV